MTKDTDNKNNDREQEISSRSMRRRMITAVIIYCGLVIGYIAIQGKDLRIYDEIVSSLSFLAGTCVLIYCGAAVTQDIFSRRFGVSSKKPKVGDEDANG